jgi:hypothetical protein
MELVAVGRDVRPDEAVDFDGLLVADQRNHSEAQRLAYIILLVFGLLDCSRKERSDRQRFLAIDLTVAAGPGDAMRDGVRPKSYC